MQSVSDRLHDISERGTFSKRDAFHLTLVFLGETAPSRVEDIKSAIDTAGGERFILNIGKPGVFRRNEGDIWWLGVERQKELLALQKKLSDNLSDMGFEIEKREFRPHITLARRVRLKKNADRDAFFDAARPVSFEARGVSLMLSELSRGGPKYTELYGKELL